MQFMLALGLEDLKSLPLELRQKVQQALDLPVNPATQVAPQPAAQPAAFTLPSFTPQVQQPVPQAPAFSVPAKAPTIVDGKPTFLADRSGPTAMSGMAVDVMSGQPVAFTPPVPSFTPQIPSSPVTVVAVTQGPATPAAMPVADINAVRSAAIRLFTTADNGRQRLAAAEAACGVKVAGLTPENAGALAYALQQQGAQL